MKILEILVSVGLIIICITWSGLKVIEFYYKTHPPQEITQPKVVETNRTIKPIDGVAPWVSDLVNKSVTEPDKFKFRGFTWDYNNTAVWVANGVEHVEIYYRQDIELTKLEKITLYNAFTNWNKEYSVRAKQNYKID